MSSLERKCPSCQKWNKSDDFCLYCGAPISPKELEKVRKQKMLEEQKNEKKGKLDQFLKKIKDSKNPFVKVGYYILYSIWGIYLVFLAIALYIAALAPG